MKCKYKNDVTDRPTSFICCKKVLVLVVVEKSLLGVEILIKILYIFCFKQHFSVSVVKFCNKHENTCFISLIDYTKYGNILENTLFKQNWRI